MSEHGGNGDRFDLIPPPSLGHVVPISPRRQSPTRHRENIQTQPLSLFSPPPPSPPAPLLSRSPWGGLDRPSQDPHEVCLNLIDGFLSNPPKVFWQWSWLEHNWSPFRHEGRMKRGRSE